MEMQFDQLKRREFISLLGGAAAAWPVAARAQQSERMRRIGVLMASPVTDARYQSLVAAFRQRLQELGWDERSNIQIDYRWAAVIAGRQSPWPRQPGTSFLRSTRFPSSLRVAASCPTRLN